MEIKFNFIWDMTDADFKAMMAGERRNDLFGSVYIGTFCVEFRCVGNGCDPDYHVPTTDVFVFGMEDPEERGCVNEYFANGTPYLMLDDEIEIPRRRDLEHFKVAFELRFVEWLSNAGKRFLEEIRKPTLSKTVWDTGVIPEPADGTGKRTPASVMTPYGDLIAKPVLSDNYPGLMIMLKRRGGMFETALIEVDMADGDEPMLKVHVYAPGEDEPVHSERHTVAEIDEKEFEN